MKITKEDLINSGIDPSLYTPEDMEIIEAYADRIKEGALPSLLEEITLRDPNEAELRALIIQNRDNTLDRIREIIAVLNRVYELCSQRQGIFSSSLSTEDTERITSGGADALSEMFEIKDKALDHVTLMFNYKSRLSKVRAEYNKRLYSAGMLNAAFSVICPDEDNFAITETIGTAFEMFNELTEVANDVNDRVIIFDEALNYKLTRAWYDMTAALDLDNDGAALNTQAVKSAIESAKQMLKDVIER